MPQVTGLVSRRMLKLVEQYLDAPWCSGEHSSGKGMAKDALRLDTVLRYCSLSEGAWFKSEFIGEVMGWGREKTRCVLNWMGLHGFKLEMGRWNIDLPRYSEQLDEKELLDAVRAAYIPVPIVGAFQLDAEDFYALTKLQSIGEWSRFNDKRRKILPVASQLGVKFTKVQLANFVFSFFDWDPTSDPNVENLKDFAASSTKKDLWRFKRSLKVLKSRGYISSEYQLTGAVEGGATEMAWPEGENPLALMGTKNWDLLLGPPRLRSKSRARAVANPGQKKAVPGNGQANPGSAEAIPGRDNRESEEAKGSTSFEKLCNQRDSSQAGTLISNLDPLHLEKNLDLERMHELTSFVVPSLSPDQNLLGEEQQLHKKDDVHEPKEVSRLEGPPSSIRWTNPVWAFKAAQNSGLRPARRPYKAPSVLSRPDSHARAS